MIHTGTRELATERLTLRRFELEDAENAYYNWLSDEETVKYLTWPVYKSVDEAENKIREWIGQYEDVTFYNWAIELNDLEQPIGNISVVRRKDDVECVELGYCLGSRFWNQGYMTEALTEVVRFFISEVGAARVEASHDAENIYSGKAMLAAGMEYEGTLRHYAINNRGIADMVYYSKIRSAALEEEDAAEELQVHAAVADRVMGEDGVMRNVISDETMEYVGILAKLELSPEEAQAAKKDMEDMLDYIDQLNELDTTGIEPMSHVFPVQNVFREDVVTNGDGSEAALRNAPVKKDGGFKVPKTIGE